MNSDFDSFKRKHRVPDSAVKLVYTSKEARCGICGISKKTNVKVWILSFESMYRVCAYSAQLVEGKKSRITSVLNCM